MTLQKKTIIRIILFLIFSFFWISFLKDGDSFYEPIIVVYATALFSLFVNIKKNNPITNKLDLIITYIFAIGLSLCTLLANYTLYLDVVPKSYGLLFAIGLLVGGVFIWREILLFVYSNKISIRNSSLRTKYSNKRVFLFSFITMSIVHLALLFLTQYPGVLFYDSINQLNQINSGVYSNHHPFYYTQLIRLLVGFGNAVFGNINAAVATYSVFSVLVMALIFSYMLVTLNQLNVRNELLIISFLWLTFMPFHIMYSYTMSKDTFYGGFMALFSVCLFRLIKGIGENKKLDYILLIISSIVMAIFRNNGWFVLVLTALLFVVLFFKRKDMRSIMFTLIVIMIATYIAKGPVITAMGIPQADNIEGLNIPIQQIARVIYDGGEIRKEEEQWINKVMPVEKIPEVYLSYNSDDVKFWIRDYGNKEIIDKEKLEYLNIYIKLGLRHPLSYLKGWVDMTRGFYNAGYDYWIWSDIVSKNDLGINKTPMSEPVSDLFGRYLGMFFAVGLFRIFISIGLHVWIMFIILYYALVRRDRFRLITIMPYVFMELSLLIATCVFAEYRYIYALFCALPFLILSGGEESDI